MKEYINYIADYASFYKDIITLNINRMIQSWAKQADDYADLHIFYAPESGFKSYLIDALEEIYKYYTSYKLLLYKVEDTKVSSLHNDNDNSIKNISCIIKVINYCEAAKILGIEINKDIEYEQFIQDIFKWVQEGNKKYLVYNKKHPYTFTSEIVFA